MYCDADLGGIGRGSAWDCGRLEPISACETGLELLLDPGFEPGGGAAAASG